MGVPTFYKWLSVRYPRIIEDAIEDHEVLGDDGVPIPVDLLAKNPNGEYDCLYLDMNSIIHPCCHPEDGDAPTSEDQMFQNIFLYVDRIFAIVRPRKLVYIAIDGVAPRAKMNQQRTRRFKAAQEAEEEERYYDEIAEIFQKENRSMPVRKHRWDSNVITPGTPFMARLSLALKFYIQQRVKYSTAWSQIKILYSDSNVPGEGEHKIMQFIRFQRSMENYDPNTKHVLYGADADLIMLGLATHEAYVYIIREMVTEVDMTKKCDKCSKTGHLASECLENPEDLEEAKAENFSNNTLKRSWKHLQFLHIPHLRSYLMHQLSLPAGVKPLIKYDFERCIDDFIFLCFFCGNDFLPHLPSLSINKGSIDQLLVLYSTLLPTLEDYLTNEGDLNLGEIFKLVSYLGRVESKVFESELRRKEKFKPPAQKLQEGNMELEEFKAGATKSEPEESTKPAVATKQQLEAKISAIVPEALPRHKAGKHAHKAITLLANEVVESKTDISFEPTLEVCNNSSIKKLNHVVHSKENNHQQDIDEFKSMFNAKLKNSKEINNPPDEILLGVGDPNDWRLRYYNQKFHLDAEDDVEEFVERIVAAYYEGLSWIMQYYLQGCPSWSWFFPFHYAPLASDLAMLQNISITFTKSAPFSPYEQLLAVLPSRSRHCLPPQLATLMTDSRSPIADFYPKGFKEDPDGKRFRWQWVALLPFVNHDRLLNAIEPLRKSLTAEEKQRDSIGNDLLVVSQNHDLADQMKKIQNLHQQNIAADSECNEKSNCSLLESSSGMSGRLLFDSAMVDSGDIVLSRIEGEPNFTSSSFSCAYQLLEIKKHQSVILKGVEPVNSISSNDFENASKNSYRFNANASKRMIIQCLERSGFNVAVKDGSPLTKKANREFSGLYHHSASASDPWKVNSETRSWKHHNSSQRFQKPYTNQNANRHSTFDFSHSQDRRQHPWNQAAPMVPMSDFNRPPQNVVQDSFSRRPILMNPHISRRPPWEHNTIHQIALPNHSIPSPSNSKVNTIHRSSKRQYPDQQNSFINILPLPRPRGPY